MAEKFAATIRRATRRAAFWLFWPAIMVVVYGQLRPNPQDDLPDLGWDKILHFTAYFGLSLLATLAWGRRVPVLLLFFLVVGMGGLMEILQHLVGRDAEWGDMLANTLGAMLGAGLAAAALHLAKLVDARRGN